MKLTKKVAATLIVASIVGIIPVFATNAETLQGNCPICGEKATIEITDSRYVNAWAGGHQLRETWEWTCKSNSSHKRSKTRYYPSESHAYVGNRCELCGYIGH